MAKKLAIFYEDIQPKMTGKMRSQIDLEFKQNQIKKLNNEFNVDMFHTKVCGGKAFAAEQKIGQFKKILLRSKRFEKNSNKRFNKKICSKHESNYFNNKPTSSRND